MTQGTNNQFNLSIFENDLEKYVKNHYIDDFNIFCMLNAERSENRHTYFLKNLFDPDYSHKLGKAFLEEFCKGVYNYKKNGIDNESILIKDKTIKTEIDLINLFNDYQVISEKYEKGKKGRIDIVIECANTSTVLIIENKIDSTTHSNQLVNYQQHYATYKHRIYVYLTKFGEKPINKGGNNQSNDAWCVYDYSKIVTNVKALIKKTKDNYIKKTLEGYCTMVSKKLLEEGDIWNIISKGKEYRQAIVELCEAINNKKAILNYCEDYFKANISTYISDDTSGEESFNFHTQNIEAYYKGGYKYQKCTWYCGSDGGITFIIKYDKDPNMQQFVEKKLAAKELKTKRVKILDDNKKWVLSLSSVQSELNAKLAEAVQLVKDFDNLLS